ncbi:immunoglobulin E-set [Echria macrotheca]|uniref:Immunoglobulin E-set n=1 Tax=Echria macrotheca TaxID=438768 RepID=A0AAJ0BEP0_9PEZI|nr:immunoglobulin E-set [Echria macrotheca]
MARRGSNLSFVEPVFPEAGAERPSPAPRRASDVPGRPYGGLPRSLSDSAAGPEAGILATPYKRYGSPYPGVYSPIEDHSEDSAQARNTTSVNSLATSLYKSSYLTNNGPDQGDESLQRYKESLGLGGGGKDLSDPNDPRVCIILSLAMQPEGRDPVVIDLSTPGSEATLKDKPFRIKEGAKFTMTANFKVQHEILSGLHYVQVIKRKGIKIPGGKTSEMIGSFAPNTDKNPVYSKKFAEEEAPTGMLARGHYTASSSFVDDDKKTHLQFEWSFDITKDW